MPAGPTSRRSTTAEAPATSSISAPASRSPRSASAMAAVACGARSTGSRVPPRPSTRARVTSTAPSIALSFRPGSSVITSPTRIGRKGATRSTGGPVRRIASARSSTRPGAAKGITLIVASMSRACTGTRSGSVAMVRLSSSALTAWMRAASSTSRPCDSATRFARPVPARERATPGTSMASAMRRAASSSATSPGSSRAAMTSAMPASRSAASSFAASTVPFLIVGPPGRRAVCASTAPRAWSSGVGPKITRPLGAPAWSRAARRRSRPRWTARSRAR